jgi:hypothetical protein
VIHRVDGVGTVDVIAQRTATHRTQR